MKTGKNDIERLTGLLMKKSLQSPADKDFDEKLMRMIHDAPVPAAKGIDKLLKNGWRFLMLAFLLMISTIAFIAYLSSGDTPLLNELLSVTRVFVLYGGIILFVPLLLWQFDTLLKMKFQNRYNTKMGF
jgi:type IV secretory pathway TrbL component